MSSISRAFDGETEDRREGPDSALREDGVVPKGLVEGVGLRRRGMPETGCPSDDSGRLQ